MKVTDGEKRIIQWYKTKGWKRFQFQQDAMKAYLSGSSGILNAPTGSGKTNALWLPILAEFFNEQSSLNKKSTPNALRILWITPLKALSKDLQINMQKVCDEMEIGWQVASRSGDTTTKERRQQRTKSPQALIITPESLHMLLTYKDSGAYFKDLKCIVVDEWHELIGSKRGTQVELAVARLIGLQPFLKVWGISATLGNMAQAKDCLLGNHFTDEITATIIADIHKKLEINTIIPPVVEQFPWAGHLGITLLPQVLDIIYKSNTTLIFTNTRSQTELWYQNLLEAAPDLAGAIAMHHGSLASDLRTWVEQALHSGILKAVVCTSTLDLGVDFKPVDTVIQIGGPKGVARFLQRAGRSGHSPNQTSKIYFIPTNSLELLEAAALKDAIAKGDVESKIPIFAPLDVLIQFLMTLAIGDGFYGSSTYQQVIQTYTYRELTIAQWQWIIHFLTEGGNSLQSYDEYKKLEVDNDFYFVSNKRIAMQHRLSIGTIVNSPEIKVKYLSGKNVGSVEESFIASLKPGSAFWFGGRNLEFVRLKDMTALVRNSKKKKGLVPRWAGGRMPISSQLSAHIRYLLHNIDNAAVQRTELKALAPLFERQRMRSIVPNENQLLVEQIKSKEGYHLFFYPFEGRQVHLVLSAMIAYRLSLDKEISFSIAMNDYGFELFSDQEIDIDEACENGLFSEKYFLEDIQNGSNMTEMARRKFKEIAIISGLLFQGYPHKNISNKQLQSSGQLFFDVFKEYDKENLLYLQAFREVTYQELEFERLQATMDRIAKQKIVITKPDKFTPFSFPIMVERLRESLSTESIENRIEKLKLQSEIGVDVLKMNKILAKK